MTHSLVLHLVHILLPVQLSVNSTPLHPREFSPCPQFSPNFSLPSYNSLFKPMKGTQLYSVQNESSTKQIEQFNPQCFVSFGLEMEVWNISVKVVVSLEESRE